MSAPEQYHHLQLTGEIVGTFEQEGRRTTRVSLAPCHVTVTAGIPPDLHLGDQVRLQVRMLVDQVSTVLSNAGEKESS